MIEHYSYYSIGGYKDFYLGSTNDEHEVVYYSPFLGFDKEGLEELDTKTKAQLLELSTKPLMEYLTKDNARKLPPTAIRIEGRGGYKVLFCAVEGGYSIVIREIESNVKDTYNRTIPFLLQFIGRDIVEMNSLNDYICSHLAEFENKLRNLFAYNADLNAWEFHLGTLNKIVKDIIAKKQETQKDLSKYRGISVLLADIHIYDKILNSLGFSVSDVFRIYDSQGNIYRESNGYYKSDDYNRSDEDIQTNSANRNTFSPIFESIKSTIMNFIHLSLEDEEDLNGIKLHLTNIINRKRI